VPDGNFVNASSQQLQLCPPGFYCTAGLKSQCDAGFWCGANRSAGAAGGQTPCTPGSFCPSALHDAATGRARADAGEERDCPAGFFCPKLSSVPEPCGGVQFYCPLRCAARRRVEAGYYSTGSEADSGSAVAAAAAAAAGGGASNASSLGRPGATGQRRCEQGWYCQGGERKRIPEGSYVRQQPSTRSAVTGGSMQAMAPADNTGATALSLVSILAGQKLVGEGTDWEAIVACAAGEFCAAGNDAKSCPAGTYNDATESKSCAECPDGKFAAGTGSVACRTCPAGKFCGGAASECRSCTEGTYAIEQQSKCQNCRQGQFSLAGAADCTDCPAEGVRCSGGGEPYLELPGYWRVGGERLAADTTMYRCPKEDACRGFNFSRAAEAAANSTAELARVKCEQGYGDVLCAVCEPHFVPRGGKCVECSPEEARSALWTLGALLGGLLVLGGLLARLYYARFAAIKEQAKDRFKRKGTASSLLKIAMGFYTVRGGGWGVGGGCPNRRSFV
jgi:hypothetical protein